MALTTYAGLRYDPVPSEVLPGLDQGALACDETRLAVRRGDYDLVVHCAKEVPPAVKKGSLQPYVLVPILDIPGAQLTEDELRMVASAARLVRETRGRRNAQGRMQRVLVGCAMGLNRSGLVVALALRSMGMSPYQAVRTVRDARGPDALSNQLFVAAIYAMPAKELR